MNKSVWEFTKRAFDHVRAKGPLFWARMPEYCNVVVTMVRKRHQAVCQVIAEGLDHAQDMRNLGVTNTSAAGSSSVGDSEGNASDGTSTLG